MALESLLLWGTKFVWPYAIDSCLLDGFIGAVSLALHDMNLTHQDSGHVSVGKIFCVRDSKLAEYGHLCPPLGFSETLYPKVFHFSQVLPHPYLVGQGLRLRESIESSFLCVPSCLLIYFFSTPFLFFSSIEKF